MNVTPLAGVWIEIQYDEAGKQNETFVTPLAGVWIEIITKTETGYQIVTSLPLRECGLKYRRNHNRQQWTMSLPLRECGLKYGINYIGT